MAEHLNKQFRLPRKTIEERIHHYVDRQMEQYREVVPLRTLKNIEQLTFMTRELLAALFQHIPLRRNDELIFPYQRTIPQMYHLDPQSIQVGQTFILESKLLDIMSNMRSVFGSYLTKGISHMLPAQVYGVDHTDQKVMALYIPPFVENCKENPVLVDGMHRSYLCLAAGTTITAVHLTDVQSPLPFEPINWQEVKIVQERPPIEERYKNLQKEYYRDLSYVGIDG